VITLNTYELVYNEYTIIETKSLSLSIRYVLVFIMNIQMYIKYSEWVGVPYLSNTPREGGKAAGFLHYLPVT
jgi:hypothetical protein